MEKRRKDSQSTVTLDSVENKIQQASIDKSLALDLSNLNITEIPESLLNLQHLEHLYLKENFIQTLPNDFFIKLRNLLWLDMRCNKLQNFPVSVGQHKCLKTLLLGDNNLQCIPAEIGLLKSLTGLNVGNNPLVDPPQSVVKKGVFEVKNYFLGKLGFKETPKKLDIDPEEDSSDEEVTLEKEELCNRSTSLKERWKNDDFEHIRSHSEKGARKPRDFSDPQCYSTLPDCYEGTCNVHGPHSSGSPCWFIHRPWTTGVFFTRSKNNETL